MKFFFLFLVSIPLMVTFVFLAGVMLIFLQKGFSNDLILSFIIFGGIFYYLISVFIKNYYSKNSCIEFPDFTVIEKADKIKLSILYLSITYITLGVLFYILMIVYFPKN